MPRAREGFRCAGGAGSWLRAEIGGDAVDAAEERRRAKREKRRKKKRKKKKPHRRRCAGSTSVETRETPKTLERVCETRLSNSFFTRFLVSRDPLSRSLPRGANEDLVARGRFLAVRSGWRNRARRTRRPRRRFGTEGSVDTNQLVKTTLRRGAEKVRIFLVGRPPVRLTLGDDVGRVRGGRRCGRLLRRARAPGRPRAPGPTGRGPAPADPRARASWVPDARSAESRSARVAPRGPGPGRRGRTPAPRLRAGRGDARQARGGAERASRGPREGSVGRRRGGI